MVPQRITGLALLAVGIILFIFGLNASHGFTDSLKEDFTGTYTDKTMWLIIGGSALSLVGAGMAFFGAGRTRSA
jgi:hypothetical protein